MRLTQEYRRGTEVFEPGPLDLDRPGARKVARLAARAGHLTGKLPPDIAPPAEPAEEAEEAEPEKEG